MKNIIYFLIVTLVMIIFVVIDGISHQKFKKKVLLLFHLLGGAVFLASLAIFVIKEFHFSILVYLGIAFILAGFVLMLIATQELKDNFEFARKVVTIGIYSKVRHPAYLGSILCLIGLNLFTLSLPFLIYTILTIIMLFWLISYEEKHLIKRFKTYKEYKNKVPMLFPCLFPFKK